MRIKNKQLKINYNRICNTVRPSLRLQGHAQMVKSDSLIQNKVHSVLYAKDSLLTLLPSTSSPLRELQNEIFQCPISSRLQIHLSRNHLSSIHSKKFSQKYKKNSLQYYLSSSQTNYTIKSTQHTPKKSLTNFPSTLLRAP